MLNLDLFGDVVVTLDDVEFWLRNVPKFDDNNRANHVHDYVLNYAVVDKIKRAKVNNSFESLNQHIRIDRQNLSDKLQFLVKPQFKPCPHIHYGLYLNRMLVENNQMNANPKRPKRSIHYARVIELPVRLPIKWLLAA